MEVDARFDEALVQFSDLFLELPFGDHESFRLCSFFFMIGEIGLRAVGGRTITFNSAVLQPDCGSAKLLYVIHAV